MVGAWVELMDGGWSVDGGVQLVVRRELVGDEVGERGGMGMLGGGRGGSVVCVGGVGMLGGGCGGSVVCVGGMGVLGGDRGGSVVCVGSFNLGDGRTAHGKRLSVFKFLV